MSQLLVGLARRVRRKIIAVAPLIAGALLLVGILSAMAFVIEPYLPSTYRELLQHTRHGDWTASRASLMSMFDAYGSASGYLFLLLQILQVLVAPIPGQLLGLLGGSLFGFWHGLLLTVLGLVIGSAIAMGSSRVLGEAVVRRFVPPPILRRFDHLTGANGMWSFFLIFLLPAFPDDAVCFMAGLTRLPLLHLLLVCTLGRLPGIAVLTFVGAGAGGGTTLAYLVLGAAIVLAFGVWLWSEELEALFGRAGAKHRARTGS
jgi:uncharacterized membrane protein YdjX (TVP38/TMEM64 family)